jgi:peptidoglycan hydrolase-like protein with peptidoglycan-binding domain
MRVARTDDSQKHRNTLILPKLKVYFQRFPGKAGTDAERGIADAEYVLKVGGRTVDKGKTAADGSVTIQIPAGQAAVLEIFGTTYNLSIIRGLEEVTAVRGQQRRLSLLGYEVGEVDGTHAGKTDSAILNFQADTALDPDGVAGGGTRSKLTSEFGE